MSKLELGLYRSNINTDIKIVEIDSSMSKFIKDGKDFTVSTTSLKLLFKIWGYEFVCGEKERE